MSNLQLKLTKRLLRLYGDKFKRIERVTLPDGQKVEVIVYSTPHTWKIAQCTIFRTIIVNEVAFRNRQYLNRVLIHELEHKNHFYSYLVYPLTIVLVIGLLMLLLFTLIMLVASLLIGIIFATQAAQLLIFPIAIVSSVCAYSWFIEYKAEAATFKKLGLEEVLEIDRQMKPHQRPSIIYRILIFMTHPPQKLVVRLYRYFNPTNE